VARGFDDFLLHGGLNSRIAAAPLQATMRSGLEA
jgi:hypothetical protein